MGKLKSKQRQRSATEASSSAKMEVWWGAAILVVAGVAAYANSFQGVLVFDDLGEIQENPAIRQLWPPWQALSRSKEFPVRPVPYWTFALNYALSGSNLFSYHLVNLSIHLGSACLLMGVVRRTLAREKSGRIFAESATWLAIFVALLWLVHPLQTQAVTYVYQRIESLMGFFFLLTLYCAIRGIESQNSRWWLAGALASCALGMGSKEVMVVAPLVVYLYDAIFLADGWREPLRKRWGFYLALASTWFVLATVLLSERGKYAELNSARLSMGEYALTQPGVLVHYLQLCFWPVGQCVDLKWPPAKGLLAIAAPGAAVAMLMALAAWGLVRRNAVGFLGGSFLLILAPTSSILPVLDAANEHRMYLPLAVVATSVVVGSFWLVKRLWSPSGIMVPKYGLVAAGLAIAVALGTTTHQRNKVYASRRVFWEDVVRKAPHNARGFTNLGLARLDEGDLSGALAALSEALKIDPNMPKVHNNLGLIYFRMGRPADALWAYQEAIRIDPRFANPHLNLGRLLRESDPAAAEAHYREAIRLQPDYSEAYNNLGAMLSRDDPRRGIPLLEKALALNPDYVEAHTNLANQLARLGEFDRAIAHYRRALAVDPKFPLAVQNLQLVSQLRDQQRSAGGPQ
ncbi:MAG: tetratricopeptide repeat protein [Pirellulaceae bacterium]|nr:tetratricopeptide repeat protein [Pirellulaceae bacterium]